MSLNRVAEGVGSNQVVDFEYYLLIKDIIKHEQFQAMRKFNHHGHVDCMSHALQVSMKAYKWGKRLGLNYKELAVAGLLHDFCLEDWHEVSDEQPYLKTHAEKALLYASQYFDLDDIEVDLIRSHMWPLTPERPKHKEALILMMADRFCTLSEAVGMAPLQPRLFH